MHMIQNCDSFYISLFFTKCIHRLVRLRRKIPTDRNIFFRGEGGGGELWEREKRTLVSREEGRSLGGRREKFWEEGESFGEAEGRNVFFRGCLTTVPHYSKQLTCQEEKDRNS